MKVKKLLRFYFAADGALRFIDNLIMARAAKIEFYRSAEECAAKVAELVEKKAAICNFYALLDGEMEQFTERERGVLRRYASGSGRDREEHRLAVAFARRLRGRISAEDGGLAAAMEFSLL